MTIASRPKPLPPDEHHITYHAPWYILDHWTGFLELRGLLARDASDLQDYVVLEKPSDPTPP